MSSSFWFTSLSMKISSSMFFYMAEWYSVVHIYHSFLIHSSVDRYLGCSHVLAIVNSAEMNRGVPVSFSRKVLSVYIPKSVTARSYGSSMYRFLRYLHTVLQVVVPAYIPTNSAGGFPFLHTLSSICYLWIYSWWSFWLVWRWYLTVVLTFISLTISDVEHCFMCLLAICISALDKCLFRSFAHFSIGSWGFLSYWVFNMCQTLCQSLGKCQPLPS